MKICENCGREYGSDNPFCPFCDERYGVVFVVDDVISADGLPPYKEEFPVIGETGVEQENFAANRDEIYKRNIRLAARENFMPKAEVKKGYKPVVPLAEIGSDGEIFPYKPPKPIVGRIFNRRKNKKTANLSTSKKILCIIAILNIFFLFITKISWFENTDNDHVALSYSSEKSKSIPAEITFTSDSGIEMKLTYKFKEDKDIYRYVFELKNKTDNVIDNIYEDFIGLEYADKFYLLMTFESDNIREYVAWNDGVPEVFSSSPLKPGETVSGEIWLDFRDKD